MFAGLLCLVLGLLTPAVTHGALPSPQWIDFNAASTPPSALRVRLARERGTQAEAIVGAPLKGLLYRPAEPGTFPAVVLLHDCRGLRAYQKEWARRLAGWGYVALLVDSFAPRGVRDVCADLIELDAREEVGGRVFDAYGALAYLSGLGFVDAQRVAVMGWGANGTLDAVNEVGAQTLFDDKFKAAVAFYPECRYRTSARFIAPTLVLVGSKDDWSRALPCAKMADAGLRGSAPVEVSVYPFASHAFDDAEVGKRTYLAHALNLSKQPARGATLSYSRDAHADAVANVRRFLASQLQLGEGSWNSLYTDAFHRFHGREAPGVWVVDPKVPGADVPPVGRSLFDLLFTVDKHGAARYQIPFPFPALLDAIERRIPVPANAPLPALKTTLIPLGRSLQRNAASPEFFKYPRVIVAVDTEPVVPGGDEAIQLKDRLYLGYQEKSQIIEVISYNEQAGRFEFQVVKDYGADTEPQVFYANRTLCTSCHQNGAPLFAEAAWSETTNNHAIVRRLSKEESRFYGLAVNRGVPAAVIDNSTDRANLLSVLQLLWREGCGGGEVTAEAVNCRAAMFTGMLQYRLSSAAHFDTGSRQYNEDFLAVFEKSWRARWPEGLKIPNPNIPNRVPVLVDTHIPGPLDPLNKRPPLEVWFVDKPKDLRRIFQDVPSQLPRSEVQRLDQHLFDEGRRAGTEGRRFSGVCDIGLTNMRGREERIQFTCDKAPGARDGLLVRGRFYLKDDRLTRGRVDLLQTTGGDTLLELELGEAVVTRLEQGSRVTFSVFHKRGELHARTAAGHVLAKLGIAWDNASGRESKGVADLHVVDDFGPVHAAIAAIARNTLASGSGVFSGRTFSGAREMQVLFETLGLPSTQWCCDAGRPMPALRVDGPKPVLLAALGDTPVPVTPLESFRHHCGACHQTDNRFPPNFLTGDRDTVRAKMSHCAERIYFRLNMWKLPAEDQPKSPMPPVAALQALHPEALDWASSPALAGLQDYVSQLLTLQQGRPPSLDGLVSRGYENTRECLAAAVD